MKRFTKSIVVAALFLLSSLPLAAQDTVPLDIVLGRMVDAGSDFETLHAGILRDEVNGLLGIHTFSSGEIYFDVRGEGSRIRMNLTEPIRQDLLVAEGRAQLFNAKTLQLDEYDLGENRNVAEFLVVGFGPGNASLRENFEIAFEGEEQVGGETVSILLLTPRSEEVTRHVRSIRLWVEQERWIPLRQRLNTGGGNYLVVTYSDIRINEEIPNGTFELDLPEGVRD